MKNRLIKNTLAALTVGGLGLVTSAAYADHDRDGYRQGDQFERQIDARQDRQMDRIRAGKRSGELTRHEFRDLMDAQREIKAMERHFLADGRLDRREYRRLDRALDRTDRMIRAEKHDQQARNHRGGHGPWYN